MSNQPKDKTIYLIRHGQSEGNVSPVFQSTSSPLSDAGRLQAEHAAERVSRFTFDALISSPVKRAHQTAEIISDKTGKDIEYQELFIERIKPASLDGKPHSDTQANMLWREWEQSLYTPGICIEDGENFDRIISRADGALEFLLDKPQKSIVVVTHGFFLRTMVARVMLKDTLTGDVFRQFHKNANSQNTGITILQYRSAFEEEHSWRLWVYNDHGHLDGV